jgi:hypothetical protein
MPDQIDYLIGELGLHIFPLQPDSKSPYAGSWPAQTTNDPTLARAWHAGISTHTSYSKKEQRDVTVNFEGCIWGVNCGASDLCATDIDEGWHKKQKRQKQGFKNFQVLKEKHGFAPTFTVKTPSGGFHLLTKGKCKSDTSGKVAKDVDIKSDGAYIVAPGTVTSKGKYEVIHELPFAPTPKWLLDMRGQREERKEIMAVVGKEMTEAQRAELEDALRHIDPDCDHDTFRDVGMGIHHSFRGDDGFEVWDAWSQGNLGDWGCPDTYSDKSCKSKWISFGNSDDPSKDITIATVFFKARENGWQGYSPDACTAFADADPTPSYTEQLADAAAHGNQVAQVMEAVIDPDAYIEIQLMDDVIREAHALPPSRRLFDDLMFEDEITILFSRANVGKTALGMQVAASIASGNPIDGFVLESKSGEKVLYWDLELSKRQVGLRYDEPCFGPNFYRGSINPKVPVPVNANHSAFIYGSIEKSIHRTQIKKVVIDNLTYMGEDLAEGAEALLLMKRLKDLKERQQLTMLIDAHTPKLDPYRPIHLNHLAGSANLGNFVDAVFAIGEVKGVDNMRYIKQLKVRSTGMKYGAGNVILCELVKADGMLKFVKVGTRTEADLIKGSLDPQSANSVPCQRRDYVQMTMANLLSEGETVTMKSLARKIAEKSLAHSSSRAIFNEGSEQRVYQTMREMCDEMGVGGSVWFEIEEGLKVEFFKDRKRLSSHVKNCSAEYGVTMLRELK